MVVIEKKKYDNGYILDINLNEGIFSILFAGNEDLYWDFQSSNILEDPDEKTFLISKENYFLYSLFERLYECIENYNFEDVYEDKENLQSFQNKIMFYDQFKEEKLFKDGVIDYHSDDYYYDDASSFKIEKLDDSFKLTFKRGKTNGNLITHAVRITNSGSRYHYFNILFMNMYQKLKEYEPDCHQVHIEEYLYNLKRTRKKKHQ